ncbi:phosphogluconate dehydrogenase (NAD(+)-dependent, decarboxylating) [Patulibacter defluvii]|uniref:phosphogluconate dehydrogenase (NAD(+)-dependent, decarboxylating) n=1 Tax=Patulibacter defluvii TaxID=3095358 RepID=UPI002A75FC4E|nr:decarboxylating 6-phosphogluconate dehydrogenase [Patulibacter sp. DM4]
MQIAFVGLGKMGGNMVRRLRRAGHDVVAYDRDTDLTRALGAETGARPVGSLEELVATLDAPRHVWVMVPHGDPTQSTVDALGALLEAGDAIVDGGNSRWTDDEPRAAALAPKGVHYLDVGTSGGVWGLDAGYCMMVGGPDEAVARLAPILDALAPETVEESRHVIGDRGWEHVGPSGSGHFVKMVHNGIEYGVMQAFAEGYALLRKNDPDLDLAKVAHLWEQGSVVRSWLNALAARAFEAEGTGLDGLEPWVDDSGEGRWTIEAAIDHDVPVPAITAALFARFGSRGEDDYASRVLAALRNQFGGHAVKRAD